MTRAFLKATERAAATKESRLECIAECEAINNRLLAGITADFMDEEGLDTWRRAADALVSAYIHCEDSLASGYIERSLDAFLKMVLDQLTTMDSYTIQEIGRNLIVIAYLKGMED